MVVVVVCYCWSFVVVCCRCLLLLLFVVVCCALFVVCSCCLFFFLFLLLVVVGCCFLLFVVAIARTHSSHGHTHPHTHSLSLSLSSQAIVLLGLYIIMFDSDAHDYMFFHVMMSMPIIGALLLLRALIGMYICHSHVLSRTHSHSLTLALYPSTHSHANSLPRFYWRQRLQRSFSLRLLMHLCLLYVHKNILVVPWDVKVI